MSIITPLDDFLSKKDNINMKNNEVDDWQDKPKENKSTSKIWIRSGNSFCTKNKLI